MTTYLKHIFALVAALLLCGCETVLFPSGGDDPYVRVLPSSELAFSCAESLCTVTIESSGKWTISGAPEWVSVTPDSGDDGAHVTISVLDNELSEERRAVLVVSCDTAEATISIVQEQKVETDYVDMGFDDTGTATQYNDSTGELTVTYSDGNIPDVKVGSAVVLPADYQFDIRVVESVATEGNSVTMTTTQGNMCNLFRNTSFTLSTTGDTRASGVDGRPVIAPSAVGYLDAEGNYVEVYNENDATTRADYSESVNLWSWHMDFNGDTLFSGNGGRLWWDKCAFDAGLNGVFNFSFGEAAGNSIFDKVGELEKFSFVLTGSVGADMLLRYKYENSAVCKDDRILKYNVIPTGVFTFLVGGVTVHLLVYTHLGQYLELGAEGKVEASGGVALGMDLKTGLSWTKSGGVEPVYGATPHMSIYHPTLKAEASMHGKVSYYPQIEIGLYKFAGPWLEPRPYVKEVVQAGFRVSTDGENYVGWTDKYFSGMDMRMGLKFDFGFWDKEVWRSDVFNVVDDTPLTTSPERLSLVSPQSGVELEHGESVDVTFMVEAYSPVTGQYWACEDAAVVFETESGELSEGVAISDDKGMVSVTWSPTETRAATKSHTLYARIYASDGAIIDEATFVAEGDKPERGYESGHEWVDLGLSVKWATCDVGATNPHECGDFFSWGEISPKEEYSARTYLHCDIEYESAVNTESVGYGGPCYAADDRGVFICYDGHYYETWYITRFHDLGEFAGNPQYDAARANWGGSWRMPNEYEMMELFCKCTFNRIVKDNDEIGYEVVSTINGNSIFLKSCGKMMTREDFTMGQWPGSTNINIGGFYRMSSTPYELHGYDYCSIGSDIYGVLDVYYLSRIDGYLVRPVL